MSDDTVPPGNSDIPTHRLKAGCSASELRGQTPTQKACGTCGESKPLADFNRKRSRADGLQETCRDCNREASRRYYQRNRERHLRVIRQRTLAQRAENLRLVAAFLRTHPCVDCGVTDIRVLDFDHRPGTVKRAGVPALAKNGYNATIIMEEIAKCDVRCRNCHAIVTYERMGGSWRSSTRGV